MREKHKHPKEKDDTQKCENKTSVNSNAIALAHHSSSKAQKTVEGGNTNTKKRLRLDGP